jgi:hypothetical protein
VDNDFSQIAHVCGDDRQGGRHGFENGHRQPLANAGKKEDIGGSQEVWHISAVTEKPKSLSHWRVIHTLANLRFLRTVSHNQQANTVVRDLFDCGDGGVVILQVVKACHLDECHLIVGKPQLMAGCCPQGRRREIRLRVDPVRNNVNPMVRNPFLADHGLLDRFGDGYDRVATSEQETVGKDPKGFLRVGKVPSVLDEDDGRRDGKTAGQAAVKKRRVLVGQNDSRPDVPQQTTQPSAARPIHTGAAIKNVDTAREVLGLRSQQTARIQTNKCRGIIWRQSLG